MSQITIRAGDDLILRGKQCASEQGRSMNEYVTLVLEVATDPSRATTAGERVRERLARAGLLADLPPFEGVRPDRARVEEAAREAAKGTPLSDIISEMR
jgi:hypothetical protein